MVQTSSPISIQPTTPADAPWAIAELTRHWGGTSISSLGRWYAAVALPGFIAWIGTDRAGLITLHTDERGIEVITLSSTQDNRGIGTLLLNRAVELARAEKARRIFLTTTNDNLRALGFYQRRGWRIVAIHPGAMDRARAEKPSIPLIGLNGIPLRDEIELEYPL